MMKRIKRPTEGSVATEAPRWPHVGYGTVWLNDQELYNAAPRWFWENPDDCPYARRRVPQYARERHERMMARIADRIAEIRRDLHAPRGA